MQQPLRVVHYINQFFGGIGGEDAANKEVSLTEGTVGSSRALQQALGQQGTVVNTLICGDNFANDQSAQALAMIEAHLQTLQPDVIIAGPAFGSGRYGLACVQVCDCPESRYPSPHRHAS